jgi:MFS superfamily sulfate permease-like transporter
VTVAAVALPSAMAYAEVAGLSPVNGLYALLLPAVAYAVLGTSRQLVIGPEGSISALVAASILGMAASGSAEAARLESSSIASTTRLFFANASYVKARVLEAVRGAPTPTRWLVLDAEGLTSIDSGGTAAIGDLVGHLEHEQITLVIARMKSPTRALFDGSGLTETVGPDRFYPTVRAAVAACAGKELLEPV